MKSAAVRGSLQVLGNRRAEWLGVAATERRFEDVDEVYLSRVEGGKLAAGTGVEDNLSRMNQLGIRFVGPP